MEKFYRRGGQDKWINPFVPNDRVQAQFGHLNAIVDELNQVVPYKVYTALLNQTGTDAPVATVLENTLGGTPTWSREGVGQYKITLTGLLPVDKTVMFFTLHNNTQYPIGISDINYAGSPNDNSRQFRIKDIPTDTFQDGIAALSCIEIRVYP